MSGSGPSDSVCFHRPPRLSGVELVSVCYRERSFPEHSHDEYVVGAVVGGAELLSVAGRSHRVATGDVLQLHPDEAHANATIGAEALRYHVLYLRDDVVRRFLDEGDDRSALRFASPVSGDRLLFDAVLAADATLRRDTAGRLEQETALGTLVQTLGRRSPGSADRSVGARAPSDRIASAKAYIDACCAEDFGLHDLAALSGLSVFHFTRSFKKAIGLSPLAYRNQRRIVQARMRLLDGQPIAQVAVELGYADQSHLTRHFQRIVGASPRRYTQQ